MRKIEFRGIKEEDKKWLYGSLVNNLFIKTATKEPSCYIIDSQKMEYDCWEDVGELAEDYEVIPETVGQWTGFYDFTEWEDATEEQKSYAYQLAKISNKTPKEEWRGVKVYEGDALRLYIDNEQKIGFVTYSNGMFGLENRTLAGWIGFLPLSRLDYLKIIGNIYEKIKK